MTPGMTRRAALRPAGLLAFPRISFAETGGSKLVYFSPETGKLVYVPDGQGNCIPDFSNVGYMGGGVSLPDVPVRLAVPADGGDATQRIQRAIDEVAALEIEESGFRGAVLIGRGVHQINSQLRIRASGAVLRGEGAARTGRCCSAPDGSSVH